MNPDRALQSRPKSLKEFMRKEEEIIIFEDFKQSEDRVHPGFKEPTTFDSQRLEFHTTQTDQSLLRKLQDGLLASLRSHDVDADLRTKALDADWDEVLDLYTQYITIIDDGRAKDNRVKGLARRGKKVAGAAAGLVTIIPDDNGLSALREGLAFILLAWKRYIEARHKIIEILAEVPRVIANFHNKRAVYRHDARLQHKMDDFFSVVFDSLTRLVEILVPHLKGMKAWSKRVFQRFTNQETDTINEVASRIDKACKDISGLFEQLLHERIASMESTGASTYRESKAIRESTHDIITILKDIQWRLVRVEEQQKKPPTFQDMQEQTNLLKIPAQMTSAMQTGLYNIVSEKEYIEYYDLWSTSYSASREISMGLVPATKEGLLTALKILTVAHDATEDLELVLRQDSSVHPEGLDRAQSLMSHELFKKFVAQDDAALLLVNGHCRSDGTGKTSPLSVWCASFAVALKQSPSLVVLHYFCGLHTNPGRALSGPVGLIKSLIDHLLAYEATGSSTVAYLEKKTLEMAMKDDVGCLCEILRELLLQVSKSRIVFCIVDNVCEFETKWDNWLQRLTQVFETLYKLVDHDRLGGQIKLKVLLTSADRSTHLADKVTPGELISLRRESVVSGMYIRLRRDCDVRNIQRRRSSEVRDEPVLLGLGLVRNSYCTNADPQGGTLPCQEGFGSCEVKKGKTCPASDSTTSGRTIGYYQASNTRDRLCNKIFPSDIITTPTDIAPKGYSHLYFAFASIDPVSFNIAPADDADVPLYTEFTALKSRGLQTWIAVGGFDFSDADKATHGTWSSLVASPSNRAAFISSLITFMNQYGFQGVDLDWEYPVDPARGGNPADTANLVLLTQEMRAAFGTNFGISLTLAPDYWYLRYFDPKAMESYVDFYGFMSYDLHGYWDEDVETLGSVVRGQTDIRDIGNDTLPLWFDELDASKINFGIALYGRGYTLSSPSCNELLCPFSGPSKPAICTNSDGIMSLVEIEQLIEDKGLTPTYLPEAMMKQITWDDQWIGYDDAESIEAKKAWADTQCFGGTMAWSVDFYSGEGR
ncbi:Acidic mammalian chitinase [Cytospora mali]|uniref:chitinase n=1 Tax=Cytospora mali TaxID=578113 RepID=A0A194V436_CYTMA|nr:Acidic mammalian chitinase [Valsa mali var. pyri (nom. inval.)]